MSKDSLIGLTTHEVGNRQFEASQKCSPMELIKLGFIFLICEKEYCVPHGTYSSDLGRLEREEKENT